jgi:hypothetical protein
LTLEIGAGDALDDKEKADDASRSNLSATSSHTRTAAAETSPLLLLVVVILLAPPVPPSNTTTPIFSTHNLAARQAKEELRGVNWLHTKHNKAVPVNKAAGESDDKTVGGAPRPEKDVILASSKVPW